VSVAIAGPLLVGSGAISGCPLIVNVWPFASVNVEPEIVSVLPAGPCGPVAPVAPGGPGWPIVFQLSACSGAGPAGVGLV
jgi:hypothetical protein